MEYIDKDGVVHQAQQLGLVAMSNDEYHGGQGVSKSRLDVMARSCPKMYWHMYVNPNRVPKTPTPDMVWGTAIHAAVLEPEEFEASVVCAPKINKRTNAGKEEFAIFEADNAGRIILESKEYEVCLRIRDEIYGDPDVAGLLSGGAAEESIFAIDESTGELIKCRTDYWSRSNDMMVDLKSTKDASSQGFGRTAGQLRYVVQTAFYRHVFRSSPIKRAPKHFCFLAVEKEEPYLKGVYFPTKEEIAKADAAWRRDLDMVHACTLSGRWPDYSFEPRELEVSKFVRY